MTVRGVDSLVRKLSQIPAKVSNPVSNALLASVAEMNGHAIIRIQKNSGSGRAYKRGKRIHIASAPGEFPNTDYGELVRKMYYRLTDPLVAIWANSSKHALPLEVGTSRMAPRPFARPTFKALMKQATERVARAMKAGLNGR
ncbi:HK97 gp10 family phage protein [Bradyrhizobium sp. LB8.2]|uniref:hypothetical protein n=1 Tax=unclassified Bradyrhizobium TaxID=2631580 RepID=UPI003398F5EE